MITASPAMRGRSRTRVTGPVRWVRVSARGGAPALRAEVSDGQDAVTIIWLGRSHIAGVEPGRVLAVEGTASVYRGREVIYNPRYELTAEWAAGQCAGP